MSIVTRKPLAILSVLQLFGCAATIFVGSSSGALEERFLASLLAAGWVCWPAVYNLYRGLRANPIAASSRTALILATPASLSIVYLIVLLRDPDPQSAIAILFFPVIHVVILPLAWAVGRGYFDYFARPLPNNSSKPTPLRGAA